MFKKQNESYNDYEARMERRADILFPTMKRNSGRHSMPGSESQIEHKGKAYVSDRLEREGISREDKDKVKKLKNLPLGKSIWDEDEEKEDEKKKNTNKPKSELDALFEDDKKQSKQKTRKERTPDEDEEFLNEFYPSMKHLGKDKVNQNNDEKKENNKEGHITGDAAEIKKSENNTNDLVLRGGVEKKEDNIKNLVIKGGVKKQENINVSNKKTSDNKTKDIKKANIPLKSDEEKSKEALKILGMDENKYQIKGNTISPKTTPSKYEIINGVKYPKDINNSKVDTLKQLAREDIKQRRDEFLKHNAKLEQYGVDHVDNPRVKDFAKWWTKTDEAVENLHMSKADSFLNTDYAKKHKVLNNYKEEPEYLHEYYKKKIPSQGEDAEKLPGILIGEKSESSKNLKNSLLQDSVFMDKLKKYSNAMHKGYAINDSMDFEDKNWHNALGKADIVNMHKNKQGDIELDIVDVNNYNEGESNKMVQIGRDRQEKGEIKPYFIRYHVIIPKDNKTDNSIKK